MTKTELIPRKKTQFWRKILKFIGFLFIIIVAFLFYASYSFIDAIYADIYNFRFKVLNEEQEVLSDVQIEVGGMIDNETLRLEWEITRENDDYAVKISYIILTSVFEYYRLKRKPITFSLSVEKAGYERQTATLLSSELHNNYLTKAIKDDDSALDTYFFTIPDFILEKIDK